MYIVKEKKNRTEEKVTNFTKVIEAAATKDTIEALRDLVKRNENVKFFFDAGGKPAMVLAYTIGVVKGIEAYIAFSLDKDKNEQLPLEGTYGHLLKAKAEAFTILRNI